MYILFAIIALGVLILVHELGHFIVAKLCGVYVERFSIGFGPVLLKWSSKGTEYCLSAIPLGGYVKLHRMFEEEDPIEGKESQAFFNKPYYKKLLIITAGVLFNLIFAVILLSAGFSMGYKTFSPVVYSVEGAGATAGFLSGDRILSVGGDSVRSWEEFEAALLPDAAYPTTVVVDRGGIQQSLSFTPEFTESDGAMALNTGLALNIPAVIGGVMAGYPAEKAGLATGDVITAIAGTAVHQWYEVGELIRANGEATVSVTVLRNGESITLDATPVIVDNNVLLGISSPGGDITLRENPIKAIALGVSSSYEVTKAIYIGIFQLITGKVSAENLGGPIMIVQEGRNSAKAGLTQYLFYIALISLNLGVLNLLPVPILDGGYALLFTIERLTGRTISLKARANGQMVGIMLLGCLMVFAFYNDIMRFFK